MNLTLIPRF